MPLIKRGNDTLYYEKRGEKQPLILINDFSFDLNMWDFFVPVLAEFSTVFRFDFRGSGRSSAPMGAYSIKRMAEDLIFLMDKLSIERADMIGFSMGSAVLQSIAIYFPKRLNKAMMLAPFDRFPMATFLELKNSLEMLKAHVPPRLVIQKILPWLCSVDFLSQDEQIKKVIEDMENSPYPQTLMGFKAQLEALFTFDERENLEKIEHEMFLVAGERDLYTPVYLANRLSKSLKKNRLEILPKVGHMLHLEKKNQILELILKWLF